MNSRRRRRSPLLGVVALAFVVGCTPAPAPAPPTPPAPTGQTSAAQIDPVERAFEHLAELQQIADDNGGSRVDPSPGYDASLDYTEAVLRDAGFDVIRHHGVVTTLTDLEATVRVGDAQPLPGPVIPMRGSMPTPVEQGAEVMEIDGVGCDPADYAEAGGRFVLVSRGECSFGEKAELAEHVGAIGLIVYNTTDEPLNGDLGRQVGYPAVGISLSTADRLREALADGAAVVHINVVMGGEEVQVTNIIADWPDDSGDADDVVMLGAHLDSVKAGPGMNDNGSGVAVTLAVAERLAAAGEAEGLRIGLWGAEEHGLLGSEAYVRDLQEEGLDVAAYVNLDMVASPNGVVGVYGGGAPLQAIDDALTAAGEQFVTVDMAGYSDHAWFLRAGVEVAGLHTGAGEPLTPGDAAVFGGDVDQPRDSCYHRACDTLDTVDTEPVRERMRIIADATGEALKALLADA